MAKPKMTEWFNAQTQPPVIGDRNALYEHRCPLMSYRVTRKTKSWIKYWGHECIGCQWRGLAKPPKDTA